MSGGPPVPLLAVGDAEIYIAEVRDHAEQAAKFENGTLVERPDESAGGDTHAT